MMFATMENDDTKKEEELTSDYHLLGSETRGGVQKSSTMGHKSLSMSKSNTKTRNAYYKTSKSKNK